ncbi:cysteine-rich secretory protein family domain-containing protein [Phthorimaea operculella]|nr:cysteine-rich secretory protein family domain-containing protein [Phthorimaea operculella]
MLTSFVVSRLNTFDCGNVVGIRAGTEDEWPGRKMSCSKLCDYAQAWANHLAHTNKFHYRNDRDVGQNLYQKPVTNTETDITGQEVSSYWYAAVRQYRFFKEPDVLHANVNAGHFTQMVWVATRFFGVGKARSRAGKVIVVANYSPPGNISGQFDTNVLPPLPEANPDPPAAEH